MKRSLKKKPFVANHLLKQIEKLNTKEEKEIIVTWSRASTIIPTMIDRGSCRPIPHRSGNNKSCKKDSSDTTGKDGFNIPHTQSFV